MDDSTKWQNNAPFSLIAAALFLATPAQAQTCGEREEFVERLDKGYGETRSGVGLAKGGKLLIELFVSESGSWTLIMTNPDGSSCLMAAGDNWETFKPERPSL